MTNTLRIIDAVYLTHMSLQKSAFCKFKLKGLAEILSDDDCIFENADTQIDTNLCFHPDVNIKLHDGIEIWT